MKSIGFMALMAILMSCGKAPKMKDYNSKSGKSFEALSGKSKEEILLLKYNNQVYLNCEIRVNHGQKINFNLDPADTFSWNIPGELSVMRILNYKVGRKYVVVVVRIAEPMKILEQINHTGENRQEFYMEYSPVMKIHYKRASRSILSDGSVHSRETFSEALLFENVNSSLFTMTTETEDDELVTEDLRCKLTTKILPQYKDQWSIVR